MHPDDRLMIRYRQGDPEAFEELYERWERRVYGFCLHYLGDPDLAADAFQDTFRRLVESRGRYQPQGRFASWLFTLGRRACVDLLRGRPDAEEPPADETLRASDLASSSPKAEEQAIDRFELRRLLAKLPASQREALLLAKYHGFSYAEIAEMVGTTQAAVKQRVYRALKTLREET